MRAGLVVGALLVSATHARAECAIQQWVGAADGTTVPTKGVLFVHDETLAWGDHTVPVIDLVWSGAGSAIITHVDGALARIDYEGLPGAELKVVMPYRDDSTSYKLSADWRAYSAAPRVLQYWHHASEWTCSYADTLAIQLDQPTAAIRARWTFNGRAVEYIEAARTDGAKAVLELGKIDCGGTTIPTEQLAEGGELELTAIRFDGSEVRVRGLPRRISTSEGPAREGYYSDAAFTIVTQKTQKKISVPRAKPPASGGVLGAFALSLTGLGLALGWRLRVRAPTAV